MWQQGDADVCAHESIQQCSNTKTKNMKETWSKLVALGVFCYTERHDSNKDETAFLWFRKKANLHNRLFSLNMPMLCFFGFNPVLICMQLLTSEMMGDTFRLFRWMLCAGVWTDSLWFHLAEDAKVESSFRGPARSVCTHRLQSLHSGFSAFNGFTLLIQYKAPWGDWHSDLVLYKYT